MLWHINLHAMIARNIKELKKENLSDMKLVEACLGGDHGQATHMFMSVVLIRCDSKKEAYRLETPIGEINE